MVLSCVRASSRPGLVSAGTQAPSRKLRPALADAQVFCESVKCSEPEKSFRCSANPLETASKGSVGPSKTGPNGSASPSKTDP